MTEFSSQSGLQIQNHNEILTEVCAEAARLLRVPDSEIHRDTELADMMDSLDAISMLLALNQRFEVDLEEKDLTSLRTPEMITTAILRMTVSKGNSPVVTKSS